MKNNLYYICSLINVITAIIYFSLGSYKFLGILWLSISVVNLTTGIAFNRNKKKKEKEEQKNEEDNNQQS